MSTFRGLSMAHAIIQLVDRFCALGIPIVGVVPGYNAVYPKNPTGKQKKIPYVSEWRQKASRSHDTIRGWWSMWPDALALLVPGEELVVVDIDADKGGWRSFFRLLEDLGVPFALDRFVICEQPSGGWHVYFRLPAGCRVRSGANTYGSEYPGVDVISGRGHYVAVAPSMHYLHRPYQWRPGHSIFERIPSEFPEALMLPILRVGSGQVAGADRSEVPAESRDGCPLDGNEASCNVEVVRSMLSFVGGYDSYQSWLEAIMALHHGFEGSETGLDLADEWSQRSDHYDYQELREKWASFGSAQGKRAITMGTLVQRAKEGGWPAAPLNAVEVPDPVPATLPLVTSASDRVAIAREGVCMTPGQGRSVAFSGPPGLSKTTEAVRHGLDLLEAKAVSTVIVAVAKRDRIREIASMDHVRIRERLDAMGGRLVSIMGRGKDPDGPFYCSESHSNRGDYMASMGYHGCSWNEEHARNCQYRASREAATTEILSDGRVMILTTIDFLPWLKSDLEKAGRQDAFLIVDDPGADFGLCRDLTLPRHAVNQYRDTLQSWLEQGVEASGFCEGNVELARVFLRLLDHLSSSLGRFDVLVEFTRGITSRERELLQDDLVENFSWEPRPRRSNLFDGRGDAAIVPKLGATLVNILRDALSGRPGAIQTAKDGVVISISNHYVIDRAREGRLLYLSVGPMPDFAARALDMERRHADWKLDNEVVHLHMPRGLGRGARVGGKPTTADKILRKIVPELLKESRLGLMTTKNNHDVLAELFRKHGAVIGYFGRDQAGTNRFNGVEFMLIQRYRPVPNICAWITASLQGALGLPMISSVPKTVPERRRCPVTGDDYFQDVPDDVEVRQVYRTFEAQEMLNAIGRCRPLENSKTRIGILDKTPVEGCPATKVASLEEFFPHLKAIIQGEVRCQQVVDHEESIREVWSQDRRRSSMEILEVLDRPDINHRKVEDQVRRLWREAYSPRSPGDPIDISPPWGSRIVSPEMGLVLSPEWHRQGESLLSLLVKGGGLTRSTASVYLKRLRERGLPTREEKVDVQRNFLKVWMAVEEIARAPGDVKAAG